MNLQDGLAQDILRYYRPAPPDKPDRVVGLFDGVPEVWDPILWLFHPLFLRQTKLRAENPWSQNTFKFFLTVVIFLRAVSRRAGAAGCFMTLLQNTFFLRFFTFPCSARRTIFYVSQFCSLEWYKSLTLKPSSQAHPLSHLTVPLVFSSLKTVEKRSEPGDLDNSGRKMILKWQSVDWLIGYTGNITGLTSRLIAWLVLSIKINSRLWIDWLNWMTWSPLFDRLIDCCIGLAPVVTRASHLFYRGNEAWVFAFFCMSLSFLLNSIRFVYTAAMNPLLVCKWRSKWARITIYFGGLTWVPIVSLNVSINS